MLASKVHTQNSLQSLPQSALVIAMCSNYFKLANLKRSKSELFIFFLSFFLSSLFSHPRAVMRYMQCLKQPPIVDNSLGMVYLSCSSRIIQATQLHLVVVMRYTSVDIHITIPWFFQTTASSPIKPQLVAEGSAWATLANLSISIQCTTYDIRNSSLFCAK